MTSPVTLTNLIISLKDLFSQVSWDPRSLIYHKDPGTASCPDANIQRNAAARRAEFEGIIY